MVAPPLSVELSKFSLYLLASGARLPCLLNYPNFRYIYIYTVESALLGHIRSGPFAPIKRLAQ